MSRLLLFVAVALPSVALADPGREAGKALEPYFGWWNTMRDDPGSRFHSLGHDPQVAECDAAIAKARKAGLADDARIYASLAREVAEYVEYDDKREAYLTLGDAATICRKWKQMIAIAPAAFRLNDVANKRHVYGLSEPEKLDSADSFVTAGNQCHAEVDKAIKAGAPADHKVKVRDKMMTLTEGRAEVCQEMLDWAAALGPTIAATRAADVARRAAPYKAAGVAGAKLDLFLEYDDVYWRGGRDCQRISDIKALAKAKALFHWLENPDGTHTIRKYSFKGNKVSGPVSKTFRTAGAAQRGCR